MNNFMMVQKPKTKVALKKNFKTTLANSYITQVPKKKSFIGSSKDVDLSLISDYSNSLNRTEQLYPSSGDKLPTKHNL